MAYGPAVLQGVLSALCTDLYLLLLAERIHSATTTTTTSSKSISGPLLPWWALALQLSNWFGWYALPRTFSSSLEACLLTPALFHWLAAAERLDAGPGKGKRAHASLPPHAVSWEERLSLALGAVAVLVRPTAVFFWVPLGLWRLHYTGGGLWGVVVYLLREVLPIGLCLLLGGALLDSWCYARLLGEGAASWWRPDGLVVAPWRFLRFNLLEVGVFICSVSQPAHPCISLKPCPNRPTNLNTQGKASLYGTHAWHWYFAQGLPAVLATQLPFLLLGLRRLLLSPPTDSPTALRLAASALVAYPIGLSLSPHKEFRFLLPILPLASLLGAYGLAPFLHLSSAPAASSPSRPLTRRSAQQQEQQQGTGRARWAALGVVGALLLVQAPMAWYFSRVHQRGPLDVMAYLAERLPQQHTNDAPPLRVDFLLPCHATPWTTHLHVPAAYRRLRLRHLDCGPEARARGDGETDAFLADPLRFARALYDEQREPTPDFVVAFASAAALLEGFLAGKGLGREASFFYSAFQGDVDSVGREDSLVVFGRLAGGGDGGEEESEAGSDERLTTPKHV